MRHWIYPRPLVIALTGLALALAGAAVHAWTASETGVAWAQAQPPVTMYVIQTPPPVPGLDYPDGDSTDPGPVAELLIPGTPVPPQSPADASFDAVAEEGGAVTASLGGSDVAVTSEGGSNEVDAPRRRAKRGR